VIARGIRRYIPPLLSDAPDFRRLWFGQTISVFGDQITQLGLPLVAVLTLGADATQMGTLTAVGLLPHLIFSLPAGVWLDRVRTRRRLMIAADLIRAALIASIPVAYALDVLTMPQLYVVGFLSGTLTVIFDLSWNTLFVAVTERDRYVEAMALLNGSRSLASVAGPTIGGLLVQVLGAPLAMLGLGNSIGTPPEGIEAEVVVVRSFEELDAAADRVKGRIVLYNVPFTNYGETVQFRAAGPSRAGAHGAVAALVRSVGPPGLRLPHTGSLRYTDGAPQIPAAAIATEDADRLQRMQDRGTRTRVRLKMDARTLRDADSFNVVGELRGRETPGEVGHT
jgi:MFS family permease